MIDIFTRCSEIYDILPDDEAEARTKAIQLMHDLSIEEHPANDLVNRLLRDVGLYPYIQQESASWQERFVCNAFTEDIGGGESRVLHREQERLLRELLEGTSIAVSAPTSFGKSFVIDAFISINTPKTVVIIVPTIALMDETRRRLTKKFLSKYKIITSSSQPLGEMNILIFPQERSIGYLEALKEIDLLVIDEFYKASYAFDKERSPALVRAIMALSRVAKQRYYLAPNIDDLPDQQVTHGMKFMRMDFSTVFLKKYDFSQRVRGSEEAKLNVLTEIVENSSGKTLIYAGTFTNIRTLSDYFLLLESRKVGSLLKGFSSWLSENYSPSWTLVRLVANGVGIHNGRIHRSLGQLQVKLFEEQEGLNWILSTSSIIEGVNTSAENVILWSNKNGTAKINDFTYKNIIGRGGRMFRHFIGNIFILDVPPPASETQLTIELRDEVLGLLEIDGEKTSLTREQIAKIVSYREELESLIGPVSGSDVDGARFNSSDTDQIIEMAREIARSPGLWRGIGALNSPSLKNCDSILYRLLRLRSGAWGAEYNKVVSFSKVMVNTWLKSIPDLLADLDGCDIGIDEYFHLEKTLSHEMPALLSDFQILYNRINPNETVDLTPAITRFSNCFLPSLVYTLEEYGLPRMLSRKIHSLKLFDFETERADVHSALMDLSLRLRENAPLLNATLSGFERYVVDYFLAGLALPGRGGQ